MQDKKQVFKSNFKSTQDALRLVEDALFDIYNRLYNINKNRFELMAEPTISAIQNLRDQLDEQLGIVSRSKIDELYRQNKDMHDAILNWADDIEQADNIDIIIDLPQNMRDLINYLYHNCKSKTVKKTMDLYNYHHKLEDDNFWLEAENDKLRKILDWYTKKLAEMLKDLYGFGEIKESSFDEILDKIKQEEENEIKPRYEKDVEAVAKVLEQRGRHSHPKFQRMNEISAYLWNKILF